MISILAGKGTNPGSAVLFPSINSQESSSKIGCQKQKKSLSFPGQSRPKYYMAPQSIYFLFAVSFMASMGATNSFTWISNAIAKTRILSFSSRFKPWCGKEAYSRKRRSLLMTNVAEDPHQFVYEKTLATGSNGLNFSFPQMSIYTEHLASIHTSTSHGKDTFNTLESIHEQTGNSATFDKSYPVSPPAQYENIFSLDLPEGKCVGLRLTFPNQAPTVPTSLDPMQIKSNANHWIKEILHPDEVQYGFEQPSESARTTFFIGRLAMRTALAQIKGIDSHASVEYEDRLGGFTKLPNVSTNDQSILKDEHGRPQVPNGFIGSISHKKNTAVALVSTLPPGNKSEVMSPPSIGVGVDIEQSFSRRRNIAKKILTPNELDDLGKLDGVTRDEEVLLRFSLKESVYKAMHPLICQFVGFQEAEIKPHNNGTATVYLNLRSGQHKRFQEVEAHWRRIDGDFFLTSSRVTLKEC